MKVRLSWVLTAGQWREGYNFGITEKYMRSLASEQVLLCARNTGWVTVLEGGDTGWGDEAGPLGSWVGATDTLLRRLDSITLTVGAVKIYGYRGGGTQCSDGMGSGQE